MSKTRLAVMAVAGVAAIMAAMLMRSALNRPAAIAEPVMVAAPEIPQVGVLVASGDLRIGQKLAISDMRWQDWPEEAIIPTYINNKKNPRAQEDFVGAIVRETIAAKEPVNPAKLIDVDAAGYMSIILKPGMRAVSVPIDPKTAAGGFILPNDRVDVVLTQRAERFAGQAGASYESHVILTNVRVLAIDQTVELVGEEQALKGVTATLEVAPQDVRVVGYAAEAGEITLALRGALDLNPNYGGATGQAALLLAGGKKKPEAKKVMVVRGGVSDEQLIGGAP